MQHRRFLRAIGLLLCMALIAQAIPVSAAEKTGFYLAAFSLNKTLIEPEWIDCGPEDTVRDALLRSAHTFSGLEEGWIMEIDGEAGNYNRYYDNVGYDLTVPAQSITALYFTEKENGCGQAVELLKRMGQFREREDHVRDYPPAKTAYENGLDGLRYGGPEEMETLAQQMAQSVADYDAIMNGEKFAVSFTASGGAAKRVTLTDAYGNETSSDGLTARVVAGEYTFRVTDGGFNRTEGTVSVSGDTTVSVSLPQGEWFGRIRLLDQAGNAYRDEQNEKTHTLRCFVPDTVGSKGIYLNAMTGALPDASAVKLKTVYTGTNGADMSETNRSWESRKTMLAFLLTPGCTPAGFTLEARYAAPDGFTQIQSYEVEIERIPTLSDLKIYGDGTMLPLAFDPLTDAYEATSIWDSFTVDAAPFDASYQVNSEIEKNEILVSVSCGALRNQYAVALNHTSAAGVRLSLPADTTAEITGPNGIRVEPAGNVYRLIPGETYTYVATRGTWNHSAASFIAEDGMTVAVAQPETTDTLESFALYNAGSAKTRSTFFSADAFSPAEHRYELKVSDAVSALYVQGTPKNGYTLWANYAAMSATREDINGSPMERDISSPVDTEKTAGYLTYAIAPCGAAQTITLRLKKDADNGVTLYQDYEVDLTRSLHLKTMTLSAGDEPLQLSDADGKLTPFDRDITGYTVFISPETESVLLNGSFISEDDTTDICGGYTARIGSETYTVFQDVTIPLTGDKEQMVQIDLRHPSGAKGAYTLRFVRRAPVIVTLDTTPADAIVFVRSNATGKTVAGTGHAFPLAPGQTYTYTVTNNGYVGLQDSLTAPQQNETLPITLEKAPVNDTLREMDAYWPSTRFDENNNCVTDVKTPTVADETTLYWATKIGNGYSADACGCPILVDGYLYTYAGVTLYKVDTVSGAIVATGKMDHSSSFAINTPTYADGMLFVGLSDGCVQAFNADTLEPLWIYRDAIGGQPNCPIVYRDGYLYTGFWLGETAKANYICLSVTDEDPGTAEETKLATWTYTQQGGFYWAGAYVSDAFLAIGTDDGLSGYTKGSGQLLTIDPKTGVLLDAYELTGSGDVRSAVTWDEATKAFYFTSKNGKFYTASVTAAGEITGVEAISLSNGAGDPSAPPMSTSTPTVYNGRAYIGVSGTSQFGAYSGHNITVIDLVKKQIVYSVPTQGYPQSSGVLTTAYQESDGCVYVYFFDNYTPGKLRMLSDKPGQTKPLLTTHETYTLNGKNGECDAAYCLFTPDGQQAQYAICSPITDEYGTLYFKNDSAYLMALGSSVKQLTVAAPPDKTSYHVGEVFDGTGMKITAEYENGVTRDVTDYVAWSAEPLTEDDTELEIRFEHVLYGNRSGNVGVLAPTPSVTVSLTFLPGEAEPQPPEKEPVSFMPGDVDGDGEISSGDARLALRRSVSLEDYAEGSAQFLACDVDADGAVSSGDARLILRASVNLEDPASWKAAQGIPQATATDPQ